MSIRHQAPIPVNYSRVRTIRDAMQYNNSNNNNNNNNNKCS